MVLFLATLFSGLVTLFGLFLVFARAENIERPFLVGVTTTLTSLIAIALITLEWREGNGGQVGRSVAFALLSMSGYFLGLAIDKTLGGRRISPDARQATLGSDLAD